MTNKNGLQQVFGQSRIFSNVSSVRIYLQYLPVYKTLAARGAGRGRAWHEQERPNGKREPLTL